jgi:hypothetical protein
MPLQVQPSATFIKESSESTRNPAYWLLGPTAVLTLAATTSTPQGPGPNWFGLEAAKAKFAAQKSAGTGVTESRTAILYKYLQYCVTCEAVTPVISSAAWSFWEKLRKHFGGNLVVPDACPVPNGNLLLTWDRGAVHFELEVERDLNASFFFVDRHDRKTAWELTTSLENLTDARIWKALENFNTGSKV